MFTDRFINNQDALSEAEQKLINGSKLFIAGLGGIGGYLAEYSARLGVGALVLCDGDCFCGSNMNRQLLCTEKTLGKPKAESAKARVLDINPEISVTAVSENFNAQNISEFLEGCTLALDALDNIPDRLLLEQACENAGIPLVSTAVDRWLAQYAIVFPGDKLLNKLYADTERKSASGVLSFVPAVAAGYAVSEATKLLTGKAVQKNTVTFIDLMTGDINRVKI